MIVELISLAADRMVAFDCQWSVFIRNLVSTDDWANNTALYVYELVRLNVDVMQGVQLFVMQTILCALAHRIWHASLTGILQAACRTVSAH